MNYEKLNRLREIYDEADGAENFTEKFIELGEKLSANPRSSFKPYSGISTFMDLPQADTLEGLDVAVIGVPSDLGVSNRSGARFGPRAVRDIERIGPYHHFFNEVPRSVLNAADVGDVPFRSRFDLHKTIDDIFEYYAKVKAAGVKPLSVGGDHSITYPIMKALGADEPIGMLHIDAHNDTGGPYDGEKFFHGGPFRQAVLAGVLDPERCIQIGIRGSAELSCEFSYASGMAVVHAEDIDEFGVDSVIEKAKEVLGDKPFYITLDIDGIDPSYAPGTGTPEVGGLTPHQVQKIFRSLKGMNVIGGDVVEVSPQYDPTSNTAQVAGQMLFEIFALMAFCKE